LLRTDYERNAPVAEGLENKIIAAAEAAAAKADAVIISDYGKGLLTKAVIQAVIRAAHKADIPVLVDHFLSQFTSNNHSSVVGVSPAAMKALTEYSWPGNVRELENVIERLVVTIQHNTIEVDDLSSEIRVQDGVALRPKRERRRTVADDLYKRLLEQRESFWSTVYPLFMEREITRANVREVVRRGLEEARGNYKIVARLFNMEQREYKRFLNFLRKHDCQIPFKEYR